MNHRWIRTLAGVLLISFSAGALAEDFSARLGRVPVDSRTQTSIAGLGHATAELEGDSLSIEGDFAGMLEPATVANLHMGIAVGARGPVIHSLEIETRSEGTFSGAVSLNAEQLAALRAGRLYIQINSQIAPDGNLWGWLLGGE